jgi:hypothetical protein
MTPGRETAVSAAAATKSLRWRCWDMRLMRSLHTEGLRFGLRRGPVAVWSVVLEAGTTQPISVGHDVGCDGAVRLGERSPVRRGGTLKMPRRAGLGHSTTVPGRRVRCRAACGDCRRGQSDCYIAQHDGNQTRRLRLGCIASWERREATFQTVHRGAVCVFSAGGYPDSLWEERR